MSSGLPDESRSTAGQPLDHRSLFRLDGQTSLIVGGYGGLGRDLTALFASSGAAVAVAGRSLEKAKALAEQHGPRAMGLELDITDRTSVDRAIALVGERFGRLDVVVNCASVTVEAKAETFPEADWHRLLEVNLTGAFRLSQGAARAMLDGGRGGRIIHFSSTRSVAGGRRGFAAYSASKGGLNALVRQLATEWAPYGITVNGVAPGFVATELVEATAEDEGFRRMLLNRIPMGRMGEPIEIATAALYLATPAASFVTGQIIFVDGGVTASS